MNVVLGDCYITGKSSYSTRKRRLKEKMAVKISLDLILGRYHKYARVGRCESSVRGIVF